MKVINLFALTPLLDRYWGVTIRSRLRFDNHPTDLIIDGSVLVAQYETYSGFLLWVTYEVRLDEALRIYLISSALTILDVRLIEVRLTAGELKDISVVGDDEFEITFVEGARWRLSVLKEPYRAPVRTAQTLWHGMMPHPHSISLFANRYLELESLD